MAVDTNVVVRFLVADDRRQTPLVRKLFGNERIAVSHTVLLETEWVLRYTYRYSPPQVANTFRRFLGIYTVTTPRAAAVAWAIGAMEQGCDFADALHVATAEEGSEAFLTFDLDLVKRSRALNAQPAVRLLA